LVSASPVRHPSILLAFLAHNLILPDDWAHDERYDLYLSSLVNYDRWIEELVEFVESDEQYRGKTAILITTDHGRGDNLKTWPDHDEVTEGAQYVWMACMAPHLSLRGELSDSISIEQLRVQGFPENSGNSACTAQIASTLAAFLHLNYLRANPHAAPPIAHFI